MIDVLAVADPSVATADPKEIARQRVERAHEALIALSHWIQANP